MKKKFTFLIAALALLTMMVLPGKAVGQDRANFSGTFTKITSTSDLTTGFYVITGSESASTSNKAMGNSVSTGRVSGVTVTISSNTITNPSEDVVYYITKSGDNYTFKNIGNGKYLYQASTTSGKGLGFQNESANITLDGYNTTSPIGFKFVLNENSINRLKWNNGSSWFSNYDNNGYSTSMSPVRLFKCPAYTVTYNPVSGSGTGSGTMTDSNNPYASGATVTVQACTFTAPTGMDFVHWNTKADGTGISYDANETFTISENTTLYAIWSAGSSVATPTFTVGSGTYNVNQSVEIECETEGAAIYYTLDGSTPTSSSTLYESAINITETKTLKAIAIKDDESSNMAMATYTMKCATPTFNLPTGTYEGTQTIEIECATSGVTIRYTNTGVTPTQYSTLYTEPFELTSTKTIKAIAKKNNWTDSDIAEATYTIINPYTTMQDIYDAATTTSKTVYIKLNNWIVTGAKDNYAYVTDGTKGFEAYKSGGTGFNVGDKLSGTVQVGLKIYNNHVQINGLYSTMEGISVASGSTTVADIAMADLEAVNTGALISYNDLTYSYSSSSHWLSDGTTTLKAYTTLMSLSGKFTSGKKYHVTGPFLQYGDTKQILPRTDADIKLAAQMTAPTFDAFSYLVADGGPATQSKSISGSDFSANLQVTAPSNYQVSNDGETWASTATFTPNGSKAISGTLHVRLVGGLEVGPYNGDLTFTADGYLTPQTVALSGTVSANTTYAISLNQTTGGTISSDKAVAEAGQIVTLSYTDLDDCYTFTGWTVWKDDLTTEVPVNENGQFTMPDCEVLAQATFNQKTFTVEYSVNGVKKDALQQTGINCGDAATLKTASDLTTAGISLPTGYSFAGWSTEESSSDIISSFTPSDNSVLYAVMLPTGATAGYVRVTEDLGSDWAGDYLIAYSNTIFADGRVGGTGTGGIGAQYQKVDLSLSITNNTIPVSTGDTYKVTLEEITSGSNTYVLKTQDEKYNYYSSNNNGLSATTTKSTAATYPITVNFQSSDDIRLELGGDADGSVFRYNAQGYFRYYKNCGQSAVYLYKKQNPIAYTRVENIASTETLTLSSIEPSYLITVQNGGVLTLTGANNGDETNLIIEDGGQIKVSSAGVQATFKKTISQSTKGSAWNTISSPVGSVGITSVTNLVNGTGLEYNLYRYNETVASSQWEAYNPANHADFTTLEKGRGYLYRNNGKEIAFAGEVNTTSASVTLTASNTALPQLKGFNLIGNPFGEDITMDDIDDESFTGGYVITNDGKWSASPVLTIQPCQGFLVQVDNPETITINKPVSKGTTYNKEYIKFIVANSQYEDAAFALFEKGYGLNKINHRNADIPMLYINKDNRDLAIATMSDDTKSFNLNFKAMTMGQYTLSYKATGEYSYLHVIDRFTGEDVDMLLEGEYKFVATPNDNEARFIVKLGYMPDYSDVENDIFAYQNGSEILVSGEGELQIFDVTGRNVMTTMINGAESINIPAKGVYIFRLVGKEIKTQKIVVR